MKLPTFTAPVSVALAFAILNSNSASQYRVHQTIARERHIIMALTL